jgi:hypothetical protein
MKTVTKTLLLGSVLGGALVQLTMLACGKVAATPDAQAAPIDTPTVADGPAVAGTFAGFSYHVNGFVKLAGWNPIIVDVQDYNTFTSSSYDTTTGTFTAPMTGYYRFDAHGWSPSTPTTADTRVGIGLFVNSSTPGTQAVTEGGQLSATDSPLPPMTHVVHLLMGDKVNIQSYSPADMTFGGPTGMQYAFYFQGEYLGQ